MTASHKVSFYGKLRPLRAGSGSPAGPIDRPVAANRLLTRQALVPARHTLKSQANRPVATRRSAGRWSARPKRFGALLGDSGGASWRGDAGVSGLGATGALCSAAAADGRAPACE